MALRTSVGTGDWSVAGTWDTGVPVNGDTFAIAAGHTVTFDVDQSGFAAGMGASSIAATGSLVASTAAGSHYLKMSGDLTLNGTLRAGTSEAVPYPSTCTFTISFNSTASSLVCSATARMYLYCVEPTYTYVKLSGVEAAGQTILSVDTDVTGDIWSDGDTIGISDINNGKDYETAQIAVGGIAAGSITITAGLGSQKESGAVLALQNRNIRLIGSTTYVIEDITNSDIFCEISSCTHGIGGASNSLSTIGGSIFVSTASGTSLKFLYNCEVEAVVAGGYYGASYSSSTAFSGCSVGHQYGFNLIYNSVVSGFNGGCLYCMDNCIGIGVSSCTMIGHTTAFINSYDVSAYDSTIQCSSGFSSCDNICIGNSVLNNSLRDLHRCYSGRVHNTLFQSATEYDGYDATSRSLWQYLESLDHNQVPNAFKAWCKGGFVTSQTASPPTGYTIWYEFAAEDTTQTYPVFRQYETTVLPGQSIEVAGKIRIADGEDLTGVEPRLQIIDRFADPLVDATQTPLDEDLIPVADGSETDWQDVDVIWANQGNAPRQVIVRMICWNDGGVDDVDIDGVWAVATYQDQIASIYNKLPTNYIMGSSDRTDKDDEIDAIKAKTDNLPASPAAVGSAMTLADDAITSAKFDETTAFPVTSADSGDTEIARTGADGDTLETLSDEVDATKTKLNHSEGPWR